MDPLSPLTSEMNESAPRIGLLGGSFNPAHDGHREISLAAIKLFDLDAVWWLVSPGNPLKDPSVYAPYEERLRKARKTSRHHKIVVSDYERRRGLTYTADTISALKDELPHVRFIWLMGADSLSTFHKWRDWEDIINKVPLAVFNRPGAEDARRDAPALEALRPAEVDLSGAAAMLYDEPPAWIFIPHTNNATSSTDIRRQKGLS
ncbi:MAG: nicotinate-nucleotide adenylyltransferase [Pseudomonadota bacterium]